METIMNMPKEKKMEESSVPRGEGKRWERMRRGPKHGNGGG